VLVVVLGGGAAAWAAASSGNSGYRMATVTRTDIGQSMTVVGTVQPVNDASASFQVAGQVATVSATVGQTVTAGESLGTLDATSLSESVSSAQSTLNSDEAKLAQDETSQSASTSATPSASPTPTTTTTTTSPSKGGSSTGTQSTITQDQNTLTQDEAKTGGDQQKEAADLAQAQQACGTGSTTTTSSTTTTTTNPANCEAALAQVSKDQQVVSADQAAVAKDEAALSQALNSGSSSTAGSPTASPRALSSTPGSSTGNSGAGTGTGTGGGPGGGTGGGTSSSPSADTPQQIAADQAAIDTAQAELTVAEQSLAEANLTSPINGTIVSVGLNVGDTVSANSGTNVIVIIGTQSFEVGGTLSSSQVPSVKVGDAARVEVDGVDDTIDGTVSQVGPVQSGTAGYTYPVVVALPSSATGLFTGSTANVVIATGAVAHVVAVPTSAVQSLGSRSYVEVLSNGVLTRKVIKVGMVGDTYAQVLSGLTPGQSVVLADFAEPVPSSNTNAFGGFGGGGLGGGGFGGGFGAGGPRFQRVIAGSGTAGAFGG
jgi:multidrug efflux pump subunit AcrA (membrane-fusion protein)